MAQLVLLAQMAAPPPPPPIVLKTENFYVPKFYDGHMFNIGDVHSISGTAALSGGTLTVKCLNGTVPDYTITLGVGTLGPWYNGTKTFIVHIVGVWGWVRHENC